MRIVFHLDNEPPPTDIVKWNPLPMERRIIQRPATVADERRIIQRPATVADERRILQRPAPISEVRKYKKIVYQSFSINERRRRMHMRSTQVAERKFIQRLDSIYENSILDT